MRQPRQLTLKVTQQGFQANFFAMASDCEVLIECAKLDQASMIAGTVAQEVWRLEDKYSRYQSTAWLSQLNQAAGEWCSLDKETAGLLDFVDQIFELSEGQFDPTSGILRHAWKFDANHSLPSQKSIDPLLPFIGWQKIERTDQQIRLPKGFELDLGGLVKEWAADKALVLVEMLQIESALLINLGGDLRISGPRLNQQPWRVGVRNPDTKHPDTHIQVALSQGGLATSGDEHRYIEHNGQRYGHLLNPKTGWPIPKAPRSATVAAPTCLLSGVLSSLALLKGDQAEHFLNQQNVLYWLIKDD